MKMNAHDMEHEVMLRELGKSDYDLMVEMAQLEVQKNRLIAKMGGDELTPIMFIIAAQELMITAHEMLGMAGSENADKLMHQVADFLNMKFGLKIGVHAAK